MVNLVLCGLHGYAWWTGVACLEYRAWWTGHSLANMVRHGGQGIAWCTGYGLVDMVRHSIAWLAGSSVVDRA